MHLMAWHGRGRRRGSEDVEGRPPVVAGNDRGAGHCHPLADVDQVFVLGSSFKHRLEERSFQDFFVGFRGGVSLVFVVANRDL